MIVAAIGFPTAVTLAALLPTPSTTVVALAYVLAVMGSSVIGGLRAGVAAALLSSLGLNFFFTEPLHTLRVERLEDIVALGVFLVAGTVVATLLGTATEERARAERRERETRLLYDVGRQLLLGRPVEDALRYLANALMEFFDLDGCEVRTDASGVPVRITAGTIDAPGARTTEVSMDVAGRDIGRIIMVASADHELSPAAERLAQALAGQVGLAIESARLAAETRRARADADVSATRAALFSSISHDLRTPLASITAAVTNLLEPSARISEAGRDEHLQTIREEAERLNRLVGSFLHLARVRAGAVSPEKQSVSLDDVIEGVVARLQPVLSGHRVRLVLRPDVPEIRADIDQLDQVLTNLLENAARHGRGHSEIQVSTGRWQSWVEVRVTDHGPGIPPSDRERVFEPFMRAEPSTDGGTGLGLSIARALVEAHGGGIWITESPGGGTTVLFRLPVEG
jgi:two-component system, OmpR family, sensor histidine kinase KdpD